MITRLWICVLFMSVFGSGCENTEKKIPSSKMKPNIVFILADDLGWADLPMYGNTFNEAPNLEQLAEDGMKFTQAYAACPVCSPTRASLQSGQYPAHVGITDFITGHWRPFEQLTVPINRTQYLPLEIETIAESLKKGGYKTGYFGKWHLGFKDEHMPGPQGYDDWRIQQRGTFYKLKSRQGIRPMDSTLTDEERLSEVLTDYSVDFIEKNKEEPFFLFLSHYDVHVQLDADEDLIDKYLNKENKEKSEPYPGNAVYAAMIEHVDRSVGRIVEKLETLNLSDNTLLIFFSDNGGLVSRYDEIPLLAKDKLSVYENSPLQYVATSNAPLRGEKGTVFEGGIREPMLVKWPGKVQAGSVSDALISSVDVYPTLLEIAEHREVIAQQLDGKSFLDVLLGKQQEKDRAIFWHYPVYHHDEPASAIRKGDWKLIEFFSDMHVELYNLKEDIGETNNLAEKMPQKVAELHQELTDWRQSVDAALPVPNPDFDENRRKEWGKHPSWGK